MKKSTIVVIILDVLVLVGFFLTYGPISYFRNLLVNTAMKTMTHKYYAYVFYSESMVENILASNYFVEIDEEVNLDDIVISTTPPTTYKNEYEEQILKREAGNEDYKIINIKIGNSKGYIVAVYDPSKIELIAIKNFGAKYGEQVSSMCKRVGGSVCINAGGFKDPNGTGSGTPKGYVIKDSKIIYQESSKASDLIGFTKENKLILLNSTGTDAIKKGVRDAIEFGPFLIVNGKSMKIVGDPWGYSPRTAIAQRQDGVVLFLVIDGENYTNGASLKNMIDVLEKYGAYNAANLDGGHSTSLVVNGKLYNNPPSMAKKQGGRYVVTAWGLVK